MSNYKLMSMEPVGYVDPEVLPLLGNGYKCLMMIANPTAQRSMPLYTAPQPPAQQPAPDVDALVEALDTALFGTPLDDVPNRDNDDIWNLCYPHLPERASDALRDHLVRIETALAAHRKGGVQP